MGIYMAQKAKRQTKVTSKVITRDILQELIDSEAQRLKDARLTAFELAPQAGALPYSSAKVFSYAQSWCGGGNDCPDRSFPLDCTHFLCHCLAATGLVVTNPSAKCQKGLCIRVNDLAAAFNNTVGQFSNVKRINSHSDTRRGDFYFIPSWFGLSKEHGMLLASQAAPSGAMVYAHTNNRCGALVSFEGASCVYYRIEDA
jgi:hypothetical protein